MKKPFKSIIAIFTCLTTFILNIVMVNAATAEELKEQWYDTHYYPIYQEDNGEWNHAQEYSYLEVLDILNPPPDLLLSMSTEELAELMQEYPQMWQIMTYFGPDVTQDYISFFIFLETNCDIFYELLRREDGITCLLEEYRTSELDVEKINESGSFVGISSSQICYAEIFGCQFIRYYAHHFTDNEYALADQIIEEKKELYSLLDDGLLYYVDLPEIELTAEEEVGDIRTNYLDPEEIQEKEDKLAAALLQMQSEESSLKTETPDTEDSNTTDLEANNKNILAKSMENESNQKLMIVVGAIICVVCGVGGFVFIRRRKRGDN